MSDSTSQPGPDDADQARDRAVDNANRRIRRGVHWLMWVGDWLSAAFHVYALVWMLDGLRSLRTLDRLRAA